MTSNAKNVNFNVLEVTVQRGKSFSKGITHRL